MSDTINLLPEDLQAKGYIPKPKLEPVNEPVELKTNVEPFKNASEVISDVKSPVANQNFNNDVFRPNQVKASPVIKKTVANNQSFWDKLINRSNVNAVVNGQKKSGLSFKAIIKWLTAGSGGNNNDQDDLGINLVQVEAETVPVKTIALKIFVRILPAIVIIVGTYFITQFYSSTIKAKTEALVSQLSTTVKISDEDIARLEKNASGLEKKVSIMRNIFDRHIYWTRLLDFLEQSFIAEVYIKSLTAENSGNLIIEAQTDSFTSVAKQYLVLQNNKNIKEVSITGADKSGDDDRVTFSIRLRIWPGIMYPNAYLSKMSN